MAEVAIQVSSETIRDFQSGSKEAYKEIYELTKRFVYNVVRRMVDDFEAEDLTHDIYVKIFEKRQSFNHSVALTTWLYRIAVNHTINHVKKKKLRQSKLGQILFFDRQRQSSERDESSNEWSWVTRILDKVKAEFRICLILKESEGLSYEEISEVVGVPIGTVRSRINRAKKAFKDIYEKEVKHDSWKG